MHTERSRDGLLIELLAEFGPYAPLSIAWRWLSYPSPDAARKACLRDRAPIPAQRLPRRRGLYVSTEALAGWLTAQGVTTLGRSGHRIDFPRHHRGGRAMS